MTKREKTWCADARVAVPENRLSPEELLAALREAAGDAFLGGECREWREGEGRAPYRQVWLKFRAEALRAVIRRVIAVHYPHLAVIAAVDCGETIELPYIMAIYHGAGRDAEIRVTATAVLPKENPVVDSISDLIPGALMGEREKQEMMGVTVRNIPDGRRIFLPDDFPEGIYPWRKDGKGIPPEMVKRLWAAGRPAEAKPE
jgi:membrane-bound hydrogenase subunit beta